MRDRSKRGFEFFNEIERRQRANAESMFGVNVVERDLSNTGEDCGVEIGLGALLHFKRVGFKRVGGNYGCRGLRTVHNGGSEGRSCAKTTIVG